MEESDQINLYSRTASLNDEDSPSTAVENASLLYCHFLQRRCKCNSDVFKAIRNCTSKINDTCQSMGSKQTIVGSSAEGVFITGSSDVDCMISDKLEICCDEDCIEDINHNDYSKVFIAHRRHTSPGYTLVLDLADYFVNDDSKRKKYREWKAEINKLVADRKVQTIALSSKDFINHVDLKDIPIHGPAYWLNLSEIIPEVPFLSQIFYNKTVEEDMVYAISFLCNDILRDWVNRKRTQGWPSEDLIRQIGEMRGHVVPVAQKGSEFEEYEWRICYNEAEIKLVHSLNEVQLMLYFKLKVFSKTVLKDVCSDITSYIIKNIIFWLAESIPIKYFQRKYFIPLFRATLACLRMCVRKRYLPNYMIPERNLFAGKLAIKVVALDEVLSHWIVNCPILEEKDILPVYKDVVSGNADASTIQENTIKRVNKIITFQLFRLFPDLRELAKSGDALGALARIQRANGSEETNICQLLDLTRYTKGVSCANFLNVESIIGRIVAANRHDKKKPKVIIEPELD